MSQSSLLGHKGTTYILPSSVNEQRCDVPGDTPPGLLDAHLVSSYPPGWGRGEVLPYIDLRVCAAVQGMVFRPSSLEQGVKIAEIFVLNRVKIL